MFGLPNTGTTLHLVMSLTTSILLHCYAVPAPLLQQPRSLHVLQAHDKSCAIILDMQDVCDFCHKHLEANQQAFANPKLKLIYDDAKAQLQQAEGHFDVIIADLADPVFGGPCYQVDICPCCILQTPP